MSTASVLLNMIAPSAPTTSQGSAAVDASAFEGLLASAMGTGRAGEGEGEARLPAEKTDASDAALAAAVVPAQTLPPAPQPILLIPDMDLSAPTGEALIAAAPAAPTAVEPAEAAPIMAAPAPAVAPSTTEAPVIGAPVLAAPAPATPAPATPVVAAPAAPALPTADPIATTASPATPPTSPLLPNDKPATGKPSDVDPQIRPALATDKGPVTDTPEVQPLAPTPTPTPATAKADPAPLTQPHAPVVAPAVARPATRSGGRITADVVADARTALSLKDAEPAPATPETPKVGTTAQPATQPLAPAVMAEKTPADTLTPLVQPASVATEKAAPSVPPAPLVQPPLTQPVAPVAAPIIKDQPTTRADDGADLPGASVAADQPDIVTAAAPEPTPDAALKTTDAPRSVETPTLRALAERASRPVETNAAVDTSAPMTPTVTAATTAPSVTTGLVQAPTPRPDLVAPADIAADTLDTPSDAPVDAAAPEAAPSAQTAAATREALPPTLSRASIEATAQIAAQILKQLNGRSTRFEMALTPDDLGRVDVRLEIDAEGRLAARLAFDNPAAATDLKGRADELRRQLEQQGFHLADDAFEFTQRDSGSSAFDRGQDARQGRDQDPSRAFAAANRLNAETDTAAQPARWQALSLTPAGVDMKV